MDEVDAQLGVFAKRTVQIGSINVCYPAFVTLISGLIISLLIAVNGNMWLGLLTLGVFMVTTYNVNCVVVGNCTTWAWVLMSIYVFYALANVAIFAGLSKMKGNINALSNKSSRR
jgi:hypothetical protein